MFKEFLMKKMVEKQMAGLGESEKQKVFDAMKNNPELFSKIGEAIQAKMKEGKSQMEAAIETARMFKEELSKAIKQ